MPEQMIAESRRTRRRVGGLDFRRKTESSEKSQSRLPAGVSPGGCGQELRGPGEDGLCSRTVAGRPGQKNKMYSREWNRDVQYRGRVRVQLKQEDGSLCLVQFPSRKSVMLYAAEMIPKLKTRTQKTGGGDQSLQQGEGSKKGKGKKKK
uniref:Signal recognition particle 19 kDa protein n=1 Tax=Suricata suricatta TaxID=37032 RepID=A0A673TJV4_SURSU